MSGALALATLVFVAAPLGAETFESAVLRADAIVLARCIDAHSTWDRDGRLIVTNVQLEVERTFKGNAAAVVEVRTLGGRVGDVTMGAAHTVTLTPGDRIVVLLRRSAYGSYFVISSATAGVLRVTTEANQPLVSMGARALTIAAFARRIEAGSP